MFVQNSTHLLYASYNLMFPTKLVPLNTGLALSRPNGLVGASTQLTLLAALPNDFSINLANYALLVNTQYYGSLQSLNLTISTTNILANFYNNSSIYSNQISSSSYININQSLFPYTNPLSSSS